MRAQKETGAVVSGSASTETPLELTAEDLLHCEPETLEGLVNDLPELTACADRVSRDACLYYDADNEAFA